MVAALSRYTRVLAQDPVAWPEDQQVATVVVLAVTAAASVPLILGHVVERHVLPTLGRSPWVWPARTTAWALFALGLFLFVRMTAADFIYFAF